MSEEAPPLRLFVDESYGQEDYYVAGILLSGGFFNALTTSAAPRTAPAS